MSIIEFSETAQSASGAIDGPNRISETQDVSEAADFSESEKTVDVSARCGRAVNRTDLHTIRPIAEWHLDFGNTFRHIAFDLGARLCQPAVVIASLLFHARFVAIGSVSDSMCGDGIK